MAMNQVLCIPQSSSITGASPSDCSGSYPGHLLRRGLTPLQRNSQCILQSQPTGLCAYKIILTENLEQEIMAEDNQQEQRWRHERDTKWLTRQLKNKMKWRDEYRLIGQERAIYNVYPEWVYNIMMNYCWFVGFLAFHSLLDDLTLKSFLFICFFGVFLANNCMISSY